MTTIWPCESVGTRHSSSHSWNEAAFHRAVVDLRRREPSKAQTVNEGDRLVMAVRDGGPQSPSGRHASMLRARLWKRRFRQLRRVWRDQVRVGGRTKSRRCSKTSGRRCSSACAVFFDPVILQHITQCTALAMLTPKRLAAALRDSPHKTTAPPPACEDHRNAIPAASLPPWESSIRTQPIREIPSRFSPIGYRSTVLALDDRPNLAPVQGRVVAASQTKDGWRLPFRVAPAGLRRM